MFAIPIDKMANTMEFASRLQTRKRERKRLSSNVMFGRLRSQAATKKYTHTGFH